MKPIIDVEKRSLHKKKPMTMINEDTSIEKILRMKFLNIKREWDCTAQRLGLNHECEPEIIVHNAWVDKPDGYYLYDGSKFLFLDFSIIGEVEKAFSWLRFPFGKVVVMFKYPHLWKGIQLWGKY